MRGRVDLGEELAEVGRLGHVEAAGAVLGRQAVGVAGLADEAPLGGLVVEHVAAVGVAAEEVHREHLVDDAGQLARGLGALHLRLPGDGVELVGDLLQHADEDHRLAGACCRCFSAWITSRPSRP